MLQQKIAYDTAQSAGSRKNSSAINLFWERPSTEPPLCWERWSTQDKLAIVARKGMTLDTMLRTKPANVTLSKELTYKQPTDDLTEALERNGKTKNDRLQLSWELEKKSSWNPMVWPTLGILR